MMWNLHSNLHCLTAEMVASMVSLVTFSWLTSFRRMTLVKWCAQYHPCVHLWPGFGQLQLEGLFESLLLSTPAVQLGSRWYLR